QISTTFCRRRVLGRWGAVAARQTAPSAVESAELPAQRFIERVHRSVSVLGGQSLRGGIERLPRISQGAGLHGDSLVALGQQPSGGRRRGHDRHASGHWILLAEEP